MARWGSRLLLPVVPAAAGVAVACSLGLDRGLIASAGDAAADGGASQGSADGPADRDPLGPAARECTKDSECSLSTRCSVAARCDTSIGVCMVDLCNVGACKSATCDPSANACTVPLSYGFHATQFRVTSAGVGCGGDPRRCFAAVYPFVFVGTTNGLVAYQVGDPAQPSAPLVPIVGLPFIPHRVVAVDRRVFLLGGLGGVGPTFRVPVAWIDVPGNPLLPALTAHSALASTPAFNFAWLLPNDRGGVFLVHNEHAFPTALLTAPVTDQTVFSFSPAAGVPAPATVAASSGSRLVTWHWDGAPSGYTAFFGLEAAAGTSAAQHGGDLPAAATGPIAPQGYFGQSTDGAVAWSYSAGSPGVDGGPGATVAARFTWLLADKNATTLDLSQRVDLEAYSGLPFGAAVAGPVALLDPQSALALAAAPEDRAQTSVQVVSKAQIPASLVAGRRFVVPQDASRLGVAASGGFAYVLAADDGTPGATVHVFAPKCP